MLGTGHMKLKNAVADIQDKYKDIRKLEKSVEIIHQLFMDMQMLVQAQGEMLDNIELNIQEAHDYTKKANVQLAKAKKSHMIAKKYKCCILITLIIIVVLVVAVPLATR
jgi:syntaxin 1B/2/3